MVIVLRNLCLVSLFCLLLGCKSDSDILTDDAPLQTETISPSFATNTPDDPSIDYERLHSLDVPNGTTLIASPAFPKSQLMNAVTKSGESVYLVASDKDNAWLLVIYKKTLGWIPSILSATGTGALDPTTIDISQPVNCSAFIGAIATSDGSWESNINSKVLTQGYLYIQNINDQTGEISLELLIEETGELYPAHLDRIFLESGDILFQVSTSIDNVEVGNHIRYYLKGANQTTTPFQLAFFVDDCSNNIPSVQSGNDLQPNSTPPPPVTTVIVRITSSAIPPTLVQQGSDFTNYSCPDKSKVKLRVGMRAIVSRDDVNLRSTPKVPNDWDANIITILHQGNKMTIIGGPKCAHDGTWWEVKTDRGYTGWIRELLPTRVLIEPIE